MATDYGKNNEIDVSCNQYIDDQHLMQTSGL